MLGALGFGAGVGRVRGSELPTSFCCAADRALETAMAPRPTDTATSVAATGAAFELVYFNADPAYLKRLLPVGAKRLVSGKLESYDGWLQMPHPDQWAQEPHVQAYFADAQACALCHEVPSATEQGGRDSCDTCHRT